MAHACPDKWLTPHRIGGSAAQEYSYVIYNCEKISENLSSNYFFELKKGIHEILYHKEVMMFFVPISIVNFFYGVAITGLPVFSRKYITDGPSGYGGLLFASSLGGIAGTYIVRKIKLEKYDISCLLCMMLTIAGGAWLGMAITIKYCCILAYIFIFFNNGSINMMNIIFVSLLQKNISFDLLGRVSTFTESFAYVMIPLGNFIGGCLLLTHDSILLEEMYGVALIFCALLYLMPSKNMNKKN